MGMRRHISMHFSGALRARLDCFVASLLAMTAGALRAWRLQLSNSDGVLTHIIAPCFGHRASRLLSSSETLERACGTVDAETARSDRSIFLATWKRPSKHKPRTVLTVRVPHAPD
jgi:hypothetical protein